MASKGLNRTTKYVVHYIGGKARLAKRIAEVIEKNRKPNQTYIEPFCGALNVLAKVSGCRFASDAFRPLIDLFQAMQRGWQPPAFVSEDQYRELRLACRAGESSPLITFVGFGCSFGGKWWGGYARDHRTARCNCGESQRGLVRKIDTCQDVKFCCRDYHEWRPRNALIYCDPPYAGTTGYSGAGKFDSERFWDTVRRWDRGGNTVLVSEYSAPDDFECVAEFDHFLSVRGKVDGEARRRVERIFRAIV